MPQPAAAPGGQAAAPAEGGNKWQGIAKSMAMFMVMQYGTSVPPPAMMTRLFTLREGLG